MILLVGHPAGARVKLDSDGRKNCDTGTRPLPTQVIVHAPYDVRFEETPSIERPLGDFELLVGILIGRDRWPLS